MIFLNKAYYDKISGEFLGIELNKYDEALSYLNRISGKILSLKDIESYCKDNKKIGFFIKDNIIESDVQNRYDLSKEQFAFLKKEINTCAKELDLTDLILYLLEVDGYILPDFYDSPKFTGKEVIQAKNLKVSKSSFNIFGFLSVGNDFIHTELYDSEHLKPFEFYIGVPHTSNLDFSIFKNFIKEEKIIVLNQVKTNVYRCKVPLRPYTSYMADSLVNWLVWTINIYRIYHDITKQILDTYSEVEKDNNVNYIFPSGSHKVKPNIQVIAKDYAFKDYDAALDLAISNQQLLDDSLINYAAKWYKFLTEKIIKEQETNNLSNKSAVYKICLSTLYELKKSSLILNLELLSIRYTFFQLLDGCTLETTIKEMKGGNINGTTILKRIGWRKTSSYNN